MTKLGTGSHLTQRGLCTNHEGRHAIAHIEFKTSAVGIPQLSCVVISRSRMLVQSSRCVFDIFYKIIHKILHSIVLAPTFSLRMSLVCCRFRIDGFVSKACGRFRFLADAMAAAAATPTGPAAGAGRGAGHVIGWPPVRGAAGNRIPEAPGTVGFLSVSTLERVTPGRAARQPEPDAGPVTWPAPLQTCSGSAAPAGEPPVRCTAPSRVIT